MMPSSLRLSLLLCAVLAAAAAKPASALDAAGLRAKLDALNVSWDAPGPTALESMPLGNGDIGLNVWVEPGGDLVFTIGKTDAWSEDVNGSKGLLKLGAVRVSLSPSLLAGGAPFRQVLKLADGEILVTEGTEKSGVMFRVWVDANNPAIRVELRSSEPRTVKVTLDNWRTAEADRISADKILSGQSDRIVWYHRNKSESNPHVSDLTFGALIQGKGLAGKDDKTLQSSAPVAAQLISIYPLTAKTPSADAWRTQLDAQARRLEALNLEASYQAHLQWWTQFWNRSWIFADGDQMAKDVTLGYVLQRFVTACGGRGAYPIKFNGSIFNVANPKFKMGEDAPVEVNADFRRWGGQYWFQNTRAMYWPRLAAGDFDVMMPLFKMYAGQLAPNAAQVKGFYKHGGSYFAETAPFWGGLRYWGPEVKEDWTGHYFTPILELSMMMLDYYEYTGDTKFAKEILVPVASAGLQFFNEHFKRDAQGKLLLDPDNAIEMYWKVKNPAPDIAGLRAVLPRMIELPNGLVTAAQRAGWKKLESELPPLPVGQRDGTKVLLSYTGPQTARIRNGENPELYAIYPFRLYGIDRPDLKLARDSFEHRLMTQKGCWVQDPIQAAMVGLTDVAKEHVHFDLTRKQPDLKFPAFWAQANDYAPDQDNGGNGENGLQQMLMQTHGRKILLLPAWPKEWNADFKLNAPYQTTVQGRVENGKIIDLVVTPSTRKSDVVDLSRGN